MNPCDASPWYSTDVVFTNLTNIVAADDLAP